ncbi:hypothetical protein POX_f08330 [Penicillium oxalicum]|uniref:hypothetical protein n=1 Tax=Penicillium oxalicum TaxID=69781 RepID=UPI0020B89ED7|nr:hypothetical protein POX_f08330 [Penicillium oxalicum]KAI2787948.1 hypothetical protein POX_f08330 [Penicillium oxalicum]
MSATTTTTATRGSLSVLADYEVHHSGSEQVNAPTTHLRMSNQPRNGRLTGVGCQPEYAFIQIMLHGCWINSTMAKLWGATGGKINDKIFYYDIGGEF